MAEEGLIEPDVGGDTKRVSPLELFFDLVFVFAITQVSAFVPHHPTWRGLVQGLFNLIVNVAFVPIQS